MNDVSLFLILTIFLFIYSFLKDQHNDDAETRIIGLTISILITLVLSYFMSLVFEQNSMFEIFIIVQIITFIQALIGSWIGNFLNK